MDESPPKPVLQYASLRPPLSAEERRTGELGALPALACLFLALYGVVALLLAVLAVLAAGSNLSDSLPVPSGATLAIFVGFPSGVFAFWGAVRISRTCRRPNPLR